MAKSKDIEQPQQTMEDYLLAQLNEEVILKDGTQLKAADGHVMTKQEAIATNLINLAMNRRSSESRANRRAAGAMPSRDGGRPIGQGRHEGKQSFRFELSRQLSD